MRRASFFRLLGIVVALVAIGACLFPDVSSLTDGDGGDASNDAAFDTTTDAASDSPTVDAEAGDGDASPKSYAAEVLADFPSMYLRLGETSGGVAADTTGDNHPGAYPDAGVTLGVPGAIVNDPNTAVAFDGTKTIVVGPSFDFANALPFTIEVWAKQTAYGGFGFTIDHEDWANGRNGWVMLFASTYVGGERWNGGTTSNSHTQTDAALSLGVFHHVALTFDGTTYCVYVDGAQLQCNPFAGAPIPSTGISWSIGGPNGCGGCGTYVGALDEFALYTHALTPARIAVHYHVGSGVP